MNVRFLSLVTLLIAAIAAAVHFAADPSSSPRTNLPHRDATLAAAYDVFRTPTETPSPEDKRRINKGLGVYKTRKAFNTQLVNTEQGPLWIFHTARLVCISHIRGMACERKRRAMQEGVSLGVFDPPDEDRRELHNFLVQGIAPDDVAQVQVLINNSRYLTVDVQENVFSVAANKPIHVKRLLRS